MVGLVQSEGGLDRGMEWVFSTARMNVVVRDLIDLYIFYGAFPKVDTTHIEDRIYRVGPVASIIVF